MAVNSCGEGGNKCLQKKKSCNAELNWKKTVGEEKFRRCQIIVYTLLVVAAIILMFITGWYSYRRGLETLPVSSTGEQRLLILFLGTDDFLEASVRADTILLFSVNPRTGEAGVLSIPRDTRVWIPSRQSWDRVNAAYAHGGPEMALEAVSNLINAPVKYYVQTDFQGFETMVDLLGGVEIEIKKEMRYVEKARDLNIHFLPGKQLLNGEDALKYVRYRDSLGDVSLVDPFNEQYDGRWNGRGSSSRRWWTKCSVLPPCLNCLGLSARPFVSSIQTSLGNWCWS